MTNDEIRMTKEIRIPKPESVAIGCLLVGNDRWNVFTADWLGPILISSFGLHSTFVIRHSISRRLSHDSQARLAPRLLHERPSRRDVGGNLCALETHALRVRVRVQPKGRYAIGLRLSDLASRELSDPQTLLQFQRWLDEHDCYVFTINGFPFGQFHARA